MAKTTSFSLFRHSKPHNVHSSGEQLERRLRGHFASGCFAGGYVVLGLFTLGRDWEKGHLGVTSWLFVACMGGSFWFSYVTARQDLRQLSHFNLQETEAETDGTASDVSPTP